MSGQRWKRHERDVASLLGGIRLPNTGQSQADVITDDLAVQVKTRKQLPTWLHEAIEQAGRDATEGRLPIVVLCEAAQGRRMRRYLVVDFERLHAPKNDAL